MHKYRADANTISMVLGNTPRTVMNHYIISSNRNYDACDIADCAVNDYIVKTNNLYFNRTYLSRNEWYIIYIWVSSIKLTMLKRIRT